MGKNSAKSKGYRKYVKQAKPIDKRVWYIIGGVVVLLLLVLLAWKLLYNDGSLKVKNGSIVTNVEHALVVNEGTSSKPKYYLMCGANAIDGFYLEKDAAVASDENVRYYTYAANDADNDVTSYQILASKYAIATATEDYVKNAGGYLSEFTSSEAIEMTVDGHTVRYISGQYDSTDFDTGEKLDTVYYLSAYVEASRDYTVMVGLTLRDETVESADVLGVLETIVASLDFPAAK